MMQALYPKINYSQRMGSRNQLPDQEAVRERIKRIIDDKGIKQIHLAEMVGIQNSKLSNIMNGKDSLSYSDAEKIEKKVGVRLAWLEGGIEPMYHPAGKVPERAEPIKEGEQLRQYVRKHGGTSELARMLGVSTATVSGYFTSANPDENTKQAIADVYKTTIDEIFNKINPKSSFTRRSPSLEEPRPVYATDDTVRVIRIPVKARAGFNFDEFFSDVERDERSVDVQRSFIRRPEQHVVLEVNGDSMQGTLQSGHEVLAYIVDPNDWPYVRNIIAIQFRDQFVIKRVEDNGLLLANGLITLTSDNPAGGTFRVPKNEIRCIYQIVRNLGGPL